MAANVNALPAEARGELAVQAGEIRAGAREVLRDFSTTFDDHQKQMAWTASLVLVILVTLANVSAQVVFRKK